MLLLTKAHVALLNLRKGSIILSILGVYTHFNLGAHSPKGLTLYSQHRTRRTLSAVIEQLG